jgi:hypothetical protein
LFTCYWYFLGCSSFVPITLADVVQYSVKETVIIVKAWLNALAWVSDGILEDKPFTVLSQKEERLD